MSFAPIAPDLPVQPYVAEPTPVAPVAVALADASQPSETPIAAPAEQQQQAPAETGSDDPHTAIAAVLAPSTFDTLSAQIIAAGGIHAVDLDVNGDGMTTDQFVGHAAQLQASYQLQTDDWVTAQGSDPTAFYAWLHANRADEMRSAMLMLFHGKDAAAFAPLLADFQRDRRATRPAATAHAADSATNRDKEPVYIEGIGQTTRGAARRAGLITD